MILSLSSYLAKGQSGYVLKLSLQQLIDSVTKNHPLIQNGNLSVSLAKAKSSVSIQPTNINYSKGQLYSSFSDNKFEVIQPLGSPIEWNAISRYNEAEINYAIAESELNKKKIISKVKMTYYECIYIKEKYNLLKSQIQQYSDIFEDSAYYAQTDEKAVFDKSMTAYKIADLESQSEEEIGRAHV